LKYRKNCPALRALPPDPYASGGCRLRPQTPALALFRGHWLPVLQIMTTYIMYDMLKPSVIWKI